jgi:hypothetical protein
MSESSVSVSQLLDVKAKDVKDTLAGHIKEHAAQAGLPATALGFVAEEAAQAVANQLRLDVFELVFKAWAAVEELREYADPAKHPPSETSVVRWGKCNIKAPQAVDVKLSVAGITLPVLRLTIDLAAEFHSLALTIQGGAIRKLTPGPASASAALKYRSVMLIPTRKTPELKFDRGIEFAKGLRIA